MVIGEFTTHFSLCSGDWDVHWGYDLAFDPWPCLNDVGGPQRLPDQIRRHDSPAGRCQRGPGANRRDPPQGGGGCEPEPQKRDASAGARRPNELLKNR